MLQIALSLMILGPMAQDAQPSVPIRKSPTVAIYPWSYCENEKGTSPAGVKMAQDVLKKLFEEQGSMVIQPVAESSAAWKAVNDKAWESNFEDQKDQPGVPSAADLLKFGREAGVDYVCAGRVYWQVRSIWVGLGPKTKANATIDLRVIDVKKAELASDVPGFKSDSTKAEKWYETGGALFLTWGITLFSGGPKTPQIERSTAIGIGAATEDFFKSLNGQGTKIVD